MRNYSTVNPGVPRSALTDGKPLFFRSFINSSVVYGSLSKDAIMQYL